MNKISRRSVVGLSVKHPKKKVGGEYFPREGLILESDYFLILKPVLWLGFFFGRIPCSVKSGWMRYSYKSIPFAYAVLLTVANWACNVYYRERISNALQRMLGSSISFTNVLFTFLIAFQPLTFIVVVYSWVFEVPAIVRCFNTTAILEKKMCNAFSINPRKPRTRRLVAFCIASFFISDNVIAYFLISSRYGDEYPLLVLLLIIMNTTVNYGHSILWCFNFYFIKDFAAKLNKHMQSCLQVPENRSFKLKTCRKIWISIWRQSQRYSDSIAVTVIFMLTSNGMIFVVGCYGLISSIRDRNILGILEMSPYVGISLLTIGSVFEMPYQAANKMGSAFLNTMITVNKESMDERSIEELNRFVDTINQTRSAVITLKDYITMDRELVISFLSFSVTYLIVLLQFQNKSELPTVSSSVP